MAGHRIVGIAIAREIALTKKGSNPHATKVVLKSFDSPQSPPQPKPEAVPESTTMDKNIVKALLAMNEVTKAHALSLPDADLDTFLALPVAEQATVAEAAKKAAEEAEVAKTAAEQGKTTREVELEKRMDTLEARNAELVKSLATKDEEAEIAKTAADPAFNGFPGGAEKVLERIKSIRALPEAEREPIIELMKSQAASNRAMSTERGLHLVGSDLEKSHPATAELSKRAEEVAKTKGISVLAAQGEILVADPALQERVTAEQAA